VFFSPQVAHRHPQLPSNLTLVQLLDVTVVQGGVDQPRSGFWWFVRVRSQRLDGLKQDILQGQICVGPIGNAKQSGKWVVSQAIRFVKVLDSVS
jgi:hypothetical protein